MLRIIQVSDSHLSADAPSAESNWDAVVAHVSAARPDLVVHTGDISLNGAENVADLLFARTHLNRLGVPWMAIPGNHDIGDLGETSQPVNATRRERYATVFGQGSWVIDVNGWRLVGIDVQTLAADLPASERLWRWLESTLVAEVPTVLFSHRPLRPWNAGEIDDPRRYLPEPARSRMQTMLDRGSVRLFASGHVHQARVLTSAGHVWAPSTWASIPDTSQPVIGTKLVGVVEHDLDRDGCGVQPGRLPGDDRAARHRRALRIALLRPRPATGRVKPPRYARPGGRRRPAGPAVR